MGSHAASCCQDTLSSYHTCEVLRRSLFSYEDDLLALCCECSSIVSREYDLACSSSRRSRKSCSYRCSLLELICIEYRVKELVDLIRLDPHYSCLLVDQAFLDEIYGYLYSSSGSSLTVTGLEHEELAVLNCELHVLHVFVVVLECVGDLFELCIYLRERVCHLGDRLRSSDTGYYVLALCVNKELTEELVLACGRAACECNACTGVIAGVTEYHGLNVNGCTKRIRYVVHLPVEDSSLVVP